MRALILALLAVLIASPSFAVQPEEVLKDPVMEERAREISKEIRCVVCQNQSIDDSDAGIAKNMRVLIRDRLQKGDSNEQVIDYLVSRYGDFVLLKPPFKFKTLVLWLGPLLFLGLGLWGMINYFRRRTVEAAAMTTPTLSAEERERLNKLLKDEDA